MPSPEKPRRGSGTESLQHPPAVARSPLERKARRCVAGGERRRARALGRSLARAARSAGQASRSASAGARRRRAAPGDPRGARSREHRAAARLSCAGVEQTISVPSLRQLPAGRQSAQPREQARVGMLGREMARPPLRRIVERRQSPDRVEVRPAQLARSGHRDVGGDDPLQARQLEGRIVAGVEPPRAPLSAAPRHVVLQSEGDAHLQQLVPATVELGSGRSPPAPPRPRTGRGRRSARAR